jgi:GT2 family glycosyltransferase
VGLLWEPFFLNCEDLDFCLRANKVGYTCIQTGKSLVRHKISASHGIRGTDFFSPDKAYYFARNQFLFLHHISSGVYTLTGFISQFVIVLPFWTMQCLFAKNIKVMKHYFIGMLDGILGRSGKRRY